MGANKVTYMIKDVFIKFVTYYAFSTWVQSIFVLVLRLITNIKINIQIGIQIFLIFELQDFKSFKKIWIQIYN